MKGDRNRSASERLNAKTLDEDKIMEAIKQAEVKIEEEGLDE